ncbi:HAD-IC family P-type ATPase [Candidatus Manganitrophus noduliformans]|uniref:Cation-translocating P-type ATPase n=1 Tax=Candidatus Manganitrophus noduliformans TaxID=2606439 RepID=A0A7X6IA47_9BACT|nr:cation-translocating P-type ATPase [Candidatus Manganitrophus noduliformans]NKE70015.1 cation-translocating P-type ATPase [Candidatus Manganitrophus noduliformans]
MNEKPWHQLTAAQTLTALESAPEGLSHAEAARRLSDYGQNILKETEGKSPWSILLRQFTDVMIVILLAAAAISWWIGELTDTAMILVIVILNAALGFSQEYRAERALSALKKLEQPQVVVRREGAYLQIPSRNLVPGDIVAVEAGQKVPADGRLIETAQLKVDESQFTGESLPAGKTSPPIDREEVPLGDQTNRIFMGTTVMTGHGSAVVTETGMRTELGKIASLLQTVEDRKTPLQRRLATLGKRLAAAALIVTAVIFVAGLLRGETIETMLLTAISLAVAAIPEGLPAMVTIVLALGAQRMVRRNALIRKLPAVETLGSVTTICTDKTGTLTQNVMSVEAIYVDGRRLRVTGHGYRPEGAFYRNEDRLDPATDPPLRRLLRAAVLCSNAHLDLRDDKWTVLGDPTEGALLTAAAKADLRKEPLEREYTRIGEIPFDSTRKMMTTIHQDREGKIRAFTKGGLEELLRRSSLIVQGEEEVPLTDHHREEIARMHRELAGAGLRLLACGMRRLENRPDTDDPALGRVEEELTFLGLFGMIDPLRPEAAEAVHRCRAAGIRPVLITGDHRITAEAIAAQIGMKEAGEQVLTGEELARLSPEALEPMVGKISIYARVAPEHKVKIVEALKRRGEIVAMTGDGVNDAPALRAADIGVAMGRSGTDVAREASEMVLLDDNFATIVSAVEEGRIIYDNIRKFTRYILSTNSGEILIMLFAILFALPLPLLPIQILWTNLVTDGLPALALGLEPPERDVMRRAPRPPEESLFAGGLGLHIVWVGLLMGLGTVALFAWAVQTRDHAHARTIAFLTLMLFQMFHVLAIRSERDPLWRIGFFSNPHLLGAAVLTLSLQLAITYLPPLQELFKTTALTGGELLACVGVASTVYFAVEGEKWLRAHTRGGNK